MWQIISPNSSSNSEPIELKRLKFQLANNFCKCRVCVDHEKCMLTSTLQENKETQIRDAQGSLIRSTNIISGLPENVFCPGCYMALNLYQKKDTRVLKDEESETNNEMFSCEKSTEKNYQLLEKATCMPNRIVPKYSNITFSDSMTRYSNDITLYHEKSTKSKQISFIENQKENSNEPSYLGSCLCMENFIDSIRPPLIDCDN